MLTFERQSHSSGNISPPCGASNVNLVIYISLFIKYNREQDRPHIEYSTNFIRSLHFTLVLYVGAFPFLKL